MRKFVAGELNGSEFVTQVFYTILYDQREALDLGDNFRSQLTLDLDPKSFQFSKIF